MDAPSTPVRTGDQPAPSAKISLGGMLTVDRTAALIALGALGMLILLRLGFGGALGG